MKYKCVQKWEEDVKLTMEKQISVGNSGSTFKVFVTYEGKEQDYIITGKWFKCYYKMGFVQWLTPSRDLNC